METKVLGIWIPFSSTNVFWRDSEFCPQGVWGNAGRNSKYNSISISCLRSSYHCVQSKEIHPRHPPREFPLGLRAPVLGSGFCRTAQIPVNEPFKQKPATSWGEDAPLPNALSRFVLANARIPQSGTGLTPPDRANPSQVFQFIFCGVAFAFRF